MATKYVNIIIKSSFHDPATAGWNEILYNASGAVALNYSDGTSSPFTLDTTAVNTSNLNNSAYNAGEKHGIPQDIIKATGPNVSGGTRTMSLTRSDSTVIARIKCWGASQTNDSARQTRWTVAGSTLDHDDRNYGDAAPIQFNTSGAAFPIAITAAKVPAASFGYPNVIILEVDENYIITSANDGNPIGVGSTNIPAVVAGFTSNIVSGTLGGKPLTIVDGVLNNITFNVPDYVDAQTYFNPGSNQDLVLSDGTNSATLNVATNVGAGRSAVTVASPNNIDPTYLGYHMFVTPVNGDKFIWTTTDGAVFADTGISTPSPRVMRIIHWVQATTTTYLYDVTVNSAGVVNNLIVKTITAYRITSSQIAPGALS